MTLTHGHLACNNTVQQSLQAMLCTHVPIEHVYVPFYITSCPHDVEDQNCTVYTVHCTVLSEQVAATAQVADTKQSVDLTCFLDTHQEQAQDACGTVTQPETDSMLISERNL